MNNYSESHTKGSTRTKASVVDLFCGAGGLSHGFKIAGFDIVAGIDIDEDCKYVFEENNDAQFIKSSITDINSDFLNDLFLAGQPRILIGCAPCQPFSPYNKKNKDPKWQLLEEFAQLIIETKPEIVSMENVPDLVNFKGGSLFQDFVKTLENENFFVNWDIVFAPDYGVPQKRNRLVLLASQKDKINLIPPTHLNNHKSVRDAIGDLDKIKAGETHESDLLHRSAGLSKKNYKRIKHSIPGGTWKDWPEELVANCHKSKSGRTYKSVYGRMEWDEPSPTITTQFFGFGNGRFGHPEQNRAISFREGAILQSFPKDYKFIESDKSLSHKKLGRLIGNAVPVKLAHAIALSIRKHIKEVYK